MFRLEWNLLYGAFERWKSVVGCPRTGLGFSGDFRLLMSTKGDDNCGSLAPPRGQYHICMFLLSIHMYMHVLFSFYFTYFSLFLVLIQRRKERGVGMGGFYREDFWDRLGFPRGFAFVGAAICRRFFFLFFFMSWHHNGYGIFQYLRWLALLLLLLLLLMYAAHTNTARNIFGRGFLLLILRFQLFLDSLF